MWEQWSWCFLDEQNGLPWEHSLENQWGRRGRDRKPNSVGGRGEAETESLILWLLVLKFLAGGSWWREAQSLIKGLLETPISHTRLWEHQPLRMGQTVRLGKRNTMCCKSGMEIYFYLVLWFLFFICFFIIFYVLNFFRIAKWWWLPMVSCWPGRRVPQSPDCWSSCNIGGKMREGGEDDDKWMVTVIEGMQNLGGRDRCWVAWGMVLS